MDKINKCSNTAITGGSSDIRTFILIIKLAVEHCFELFSALNYFFKFAMNACSLPFSDRTLKPSS